MLDSSYQSQIGLVIDDLRTILGLIQVDQQLTRRAVSQYTQAQLELLSKVKSDQSSLHRLLESMSQFSRSQVPVDDQDPTGTLLGFTRAIQVRARIYGTLSCTSSRSCSCHVTKAIQSPHFLRQVVGILLIRYSGHHFWNRKACTEADCPGLSMFHGFIQYFFPVRL